MLTMSAPSDLTKQERDMLKIVREELARARERRLVGTLAIKMVLNDGYPTNHFVTIEYKVK